VSELWGPLYRFIDDFVEKQSEDDMGMH